MRKLRNSSFLLIALFILALKASAQRDSSPHKVQFVTVEQGVQLEVRIGVVPELRLSSSPEAETPRIVLTALLHSSRNSTRSTASREGGLARPAAQRRLMATTPRTISAMTCLR